MASIALLSLAALAGAQTVGRSASEWTVAYQKAQTLVSQMTLAEMNNMTYGQPSTTGCSGVSGSVPRLGFPGLCLQDAGNGVRGTDGVNAYASGIHVGASWNKKLTHARGQYMGAEFKRKGVNVALGPVVGPLGRTAEGGRNWEGFGADAYLDGILAGLTVAGLQESVIASVKHFIGNEQEYRRGPVNGSLAISNDISDETLHELYLWPFEDTVEAGAGCVMCSYNRINGTYGCEDDRTLNQILKQEVGFKGFVVSDWGAQKSGFKSANGGLDMTMPSSTYWENSSLALAVQNGSFDRARLENMATRIAAAWYVLEQDHEDYPPTGIGMIKNLSAPHTFVNARDPNSKDTIYQGAVEGHVLLKNTGSLPLNKPNVMSIFGYDAVTPPVGSPKLVVGSFGAQDWWTLGWANMNGTGISFTQFIYGDLSPSSLGRVNGTQYTGGGSGSSTPPYISAPYDALAERAYGDGTFLYHNFESFSPLVPQSDACLVFVNEFATEGFDRPNIADPESDQLIEHVASQCNNTIVVVHNAGVRTASWIDNANITAVIYAHLPGQDSGRSLAAILHGDVSPSGRLPYTVPRVAEDYGDLLHPCLENGNTTSPTCEFKEGVNIDYRGFLARNVEPLFPFGFGLTYSNFTYSDLEVHTNVSCRSNSSSLFDTVGYVTAHIENTGSVQAAEVAQLYIERPGYVRALRGFEKVSLTPAEGTNVKFLLRKKDISVWNTDLQQWVVPCGESKVYVGKDVLDVPLTGSLNL